MRTKSVQGAKDSEEAPNMALQMTIDPATAFAAANALAAASATELGRYVAD